MAIVSRGRRRAVRTSASGAGAASAGIAGDDGSRSTAGTDPGNSGGSDGSESGGTPASDGGAMNTGGSMGGQSSTGTQPLGAICANDTNCSQARGAAVCCQSTCTLAAQCQLSTNYLSCNSTADCAAWGGGKLCCEESAGPETMRFCTKQAACSGRVLP
jgi:hypothetical protein